MNQQAMLRKVKQLQKEMLDTQEEINQTEFKTTCGPVTIVMLGTKDIKQVIFDENFKIEDKEDFAMLGDMIVACSHQATSEIDNYTEEKMGKYKSMLGI